MSDKERGLYGKYRIERMDGRSAPGEKHANCFLFVLDLDHDPFALEALKAYANASRHEYSKLTEDLEEIINHYEYIRNRTENSDE